MQINHNIRAMVTQQSLYLNDNAMTKSLEKLSTGLRINRAQDDAAGLAMSEQMRTQIRGLAKAKRNALDGQAALQIAEGALAEITNMMQRQKELAVQSANDTLTSTERMYLNDEFQALTKEIDRIAKNTDYNGKNVLLFDVDPNKSFAATKLDPYNKDVTFLEGANVIYKTFGQNLNGAFASLTADFKSMDLLDKYLNTTGSAKATAKTAFNDNGGLSGANKINVILNDINKVISDLGGILTDSNIKTTLQLLKNAGEGLGDLAQALNVNLIDATATALVPPGASHVTLNLAGDLLHTNTVSYMDAAYKTDNQDAKNKYYTTGSGLIEDEKTASNMELLKEINTFLRDVNDALRAYESAEKGEFKVKEGAIQTITYTFMNNIKGSDLAKVRDISGTTDIGSLDRIINQIGVAYGKMDATTGAVADKDALIASLGSIFSTTASKQMQDDLKAVLALDVNKLPVNGLRDEIAAWQKNITDLKDAYKTYSEADIATGSAASEVLHVGPNYSSGLGGATSNQIHVNYVSVDVKGLGLQAQVIDTREGAQRAIDNIQANIKVMSSNRAAIGTYINRLDYTVNNIASMEYNIQDAESRIRDTDFATETTSFTRNQIMVQASTSMLAQANSLPQAVLGLIG
jgi:flagellin-like hook-associated protein FlgL